MNCNATELLIATLSQLLVGCRHVVVGASSPIPGAAALLARSRCGTAMRVTILGSQLNNAYTNGGVETFDLAAQGRIDAFFLGGGQIDGQANINLVGAGDYPASAMRWPGSFGSAYIYFLVPKVILFREEHTRRVMVRKVDFISAPGVSDPGVYRPGGPWKMVTGRGMFHFDRERRRFRLQSVHPGHSVEEIRDHTGFDFDQPAQVGFTPLPDEQTLQILRGPVREEIAECYPLFAADFAATSIETA